jgi:hypothetical protein
MSQNLLKMIKQTALLSTMKTRYINPELETIPPETTARNDLTINQNTQWVYP